jgi:hypothetical protein
VWLKRIPSDATNATVSRSTLQMSLADSRHRILALKGSLAASEGASSRSMTSANARCASYTR